ncbi:hypothetical protein Tco_0738588 [Tanacetum coccineum]
MRIEQYLLMTDYALWEVILNGDSPLLTRTVDGVETAVPPTIVEQRLARKNELKARGTLLMALPNKHQLKFNTYKSSKTLMEVIEKMFGGLDQTYDRLKKLISQLEIHGETISQEDVNLKLLRSLPSEWKTHTLIWRNKPDLEDLSMDDLYKNLKIYEAGVMGSCSTIQNTQNVAFVSSNSTSSTNEAVKTAHGVFATNYKANASTLPNVDSLSDVVIYSFFASQNNSSQLDNEDLKQIDPYDLEEMDLKWQMAIPRWNAIIATEECDGFGYDWSDHVEEGPTNFALMAYTSSGSSSSSSSDTEVSTCSKACLKSYETLKEHYDNLTKDFNKSQLNVGAYKACLESIEARLDVYRKNEAIFEEDIQILKLDIKLRDNALAELRKKFEKVEKERDDLKLTLEKFENSSKNLSKLLDSQVSDKFKTGVGFDSQVFDSQVNDKYKSCERYHVVPPPYTGNFMPPKPDLVFADKDEYISDSESENEIESKSRQRKPSNAKVEFVKSNERVKSSRESVKKIENNKKAEYPRKNSQSPRDNKRNWNNLMTQKLGTAISVNTARPINTSYPRPTVNSARPMSNVFNKAYSHVSRPFNKFITNKNSNFNEKVNTVRGNVTIVRPKAVGNPQQDLKDKGVIDSGCSRHMTGNKSYLTDYEEIDGGFVAFEGNSKGGKITRKGKIRTGKLDFEDVYFVKELKFNLFSVSQMCDKKNSVLFTDTEYVVLSPDFKLTDKRYSTNSKAFRVFNTRTRIVEENLHVQFSETTPNIAGTGPNWLFDIDALTKSMNYKPVVAGNQSNGSAGTKACDDAGKARDSPDAGFKPSWEEEKKDVEDPENKDSEVSSTEEPRVNQEEDANINNTNNINTVSPTVNVAGIEDNVVDKNIVYGCVDDLNMPNLEEIVYSDDDEDNDAEADMNNLNTFMLTAKGAHFGAYYSEDQYTVSIKKIPRDLDNSTNNVLIPLDSWTSGLLVYRLPLSGQFLKELRENTFSGLDNEDANEHIEKVLEIVDLFHVPNINVDQLMLRVFPVSLTRAAA